VRKVEGLANLLSTSIFGDGACEEHGDSGVRGETREGGAL